MKRLVLFFVIAVSLYLLRQACSKESNSSAIMVICTTTMIADAVKSIGEPYITIKTLMGPGIDPHLYRPRESDVAALSNARLIFYNGLHLEGKMGEIFAHMNQYVPTVAVADVIHVNDRIASEFQGMYDPHVWHDVSLWVQIVPSIVKALSDMDPAHAGYYQERAAIYTKQLQQLDQWIQEQIQKIPKKHRILVTAHDAFSYFGRAYGMQVVGLQGISTDAQVSMHDMQQAVDYIVNNTIPAVFLESSISPQSIQAVQRAVQAVGHSVTIAPELFSDSLGDASTTADSYCGMMQYNVKTITEALMVAFPVRPDPSLHSEVLAQSSLRSP